jgi:hypothetical protein
LKEAEALGTHEIFKNAFVRKYWSTSTWELNVSWTIDLVEEDGTVIGGDDGVIVEKHGPSLLSLKHNPPL